MISLHIGTKFFLGEMGITVFASRGGRDQSGFLVAYFNPLIFLYS